MFDNMTREQLIQEIERLREENLVLSLKVNLDGLYPEQPITVPGNWAGPAVSKPVVPDGYAGPARNIGEAPEGWALPAALGGGVQGKVLHSYTFDLKTGAKIS